MAISSRGVPPLRPFLLKVRVKRVFARHFLGPFHPLALVSNGVRRGVIYWLVVAGTVVSSPFGLSGELWSFSHGASGYRGQGRAALVLTLLSPMVTRLVSHLSPTF